MLILFCADPLSPRKPDPMYEAEYHAAGLAGFQRGLVTLEPLVYGGNISEVVRSLPIHEPPVPAIYRGWMLKPNQYTALYDALNARCIQLMTSPAAYQHAHYLPESYSVLEGHTPKTIWTPFTSETSLQDILSELQIFGQSPIIVKDYVKSQKHYWHEACFIPNAADISQARTVIERFLALQGDDLNVGLVFRAYVDMEPLGLHQQSGMPTSREYRTFYWQGEPLISAPYWEQGDDSTDTPPTDLFLTLAQQVKSPFFSMDVAKLNGGGWTIMELGDGQVAGLPAMVQPEDFYQSLYSKISPTGT